MDASIDLKRDYPDGFLAALANALQNDKRDASATGVSIMAKFLFSNTVIPLKTVGRGVCLEANPHHLGGGIAQLPETIKRLAV